MSNAPPLDPADPLAWSAGRTFLRTYRVSVLFLTLFLVFFGLNSWWVTSAVREVRANEQRSVENRQLLNAREGALHRYQARLSALEERVARLEASRGR